MSSCVVLCNDDGIAAPALHTLAQILLDMGMEVVIFAPSENRSACGMSLTLRKPLELKNHIALEKEGLRVFSLAGTPSDCAIAIGDGILEKLGIDSKPKLLVSGVNVGSNLSVDVWHSGTIAAAREASLYGIPGVAISLTTFDESHMPRALNASSKLLQKVLEIIPEEPVNWPRDIDAGLEDNALQSFLSGQSFLNVNIPPEWTGDFTCTTLGRRYYLGALSLIGNHIEIGASEIVNGESEAGDVDAIVRGEASISLLSAHPSQHPDFPPDTVFEEHMQARNGWPTWFQD